MPPGFGANVTVTLVAFIRSENVITTGSAGRTSFALFAGDVLTTVGGVESIVKSVGLVVHVTRRVSSPTHTWMRAWVVVAEHPFYAVTGPNGEFALDNVPPGKYTLKIWQEVLGTVTREVTVGDKDTTGVTVEMGKK